MEYLDIINEQDEVTGRAGREEIYQNNLPHRIVHVMLFNDKGEMALALRNKDLSYCPNHWCTAAAGHVNAGEDYEQAALRELEEEMGIKSDILFHSKDYYQSSDSPGLWMYLGTYKTFHNGPFNPNPREVEKVEFFSLDKIKQMVAAGEKIHYETLFLLRKYFL